MNEPDTQADGTTPKAKTEPMPSLWWLSPWTFAIQLWAAMERQYAKHLELAKACADDRIKLVKLEQEYAEVVAYNIQLKADLNFAHETVDLRNGTITQLRKDLADACSQANEAGDDIEKLAAKCLELEQKVMDLEAKWPRDLWNGGKIYGDVYTCQPKPYYPDAHKDLIEKYAKADAKRKRKSKAKKKGGRRA